ncbi:MAG TPA: SAM-dependent methyltransferase [Thermoanaerobaculia bacterium]|nr:SAM-dependent methyltransferase [Thermoanaerobaculia bacterium]
MIEIVEDIAETARWVAIHRAIESERPDALFRDPYARALAGERGAEIERSLPRGSVAHLSTAVRTCLFDDFILGAIERDGIETVLNLAAGLDMRPFRLPLPATLRWIEVDLPQTIAYKEKRLSGERPRCVFERVALDLAVPAARRALFERVDRETRGPVLAVTEGLLIYLTAEQVAGLAQDLARPSFRFWVTDLSSPAQLRQLQDSWGGGVGQQARFQFSPAEGPQFFAAFGWQPREFRSTWEEGHRLQREGWRSRVLRIVARLSAERRELFRTFSGTLLLAHSAAPTPTDHRPLPLT